METRLEMWAELQPFVQKEIQDQLAAYKKQDATKYGVAATPLHYHNGADAPTLPAQSLIPFLPLPATGGGVASQEVLDGQVINDTTQASNPKLAGTKDAPAIYVDPLPIIYSSGSEAFNGGDAPIGTILIHTNPTEAGTSLWMRVNPAPGFTGGTFTVTGATIPNGATSATLTSDWEWPTGIYWIFFSNGNQRPAGFINNSTAVSWDNGTVGSSTTTIRVSGNAWVGVSMNQMIPE